MLIIIIIIIIYVIIDLPDQISSVQTEHAEIIRSNPNSQKSIKKSK